MESVFLLIGLCIVLFIAYRVGKWEDAWQIEMLQADNVRLTGEIYRISRELAKGDYQNGKKMPSIFAHILNENTEKLEDIKWE